MSSNFSVDISNANEPPLSLYLVTLDTYVTGEVFENHRVGDVVATVMAYDPDRHDSLKFSVNSSTIKTTFEVHHAECETVNEIDEVLLVDTKRV